MPPGLIGTVKDKTEDSEHRYGKQQGNDKNTPLPAAGFFDGHALSPVFLLNLPRASDYFQLARSIILTASALFTPS